MSIALILGGCGTAVREPDSSYTVQPGDTLYSIAWRHGVDFHDLARLNHLGSDYRITVGERLQLHPPAGEAITASGAAQRTPPLRTSPLVLALQWGWPTARPVVPIPVPSGGVLLPGRVGQDNRAAAAGRVVYNGDGIRGYGNLIIIKHSDAVLSAYAHNRDSLVHEGQEVTLGQVIGHMGEGAPGKPVLYFEIRLNGKPIDPLPVLSVARPAEPPPRDVVRQPTR